MSAPVAVTEHLRDILETVPRLSPREVPLLDAQGLCLVEEVRSPMAVPSFDNSAMDGYAVAVADLGAADAATPVRLPVTAEIHAGAVDGTRVESGSVVRIMTGAAMPPGADAVVPFELVRESDQMAEFVEVPEPGRHVRRIGSDVAQGDVLLPAGTRLGPREIGVLANVGIATVAATPRLRVLVMSTGAELVEPGGALEPGTIFDSNSFLLAAAVTAVGAVSVRAHHPSDDPDALVTALEGQLGEVDAVVTTGGVSQGTRDVVKEALRDRLTFRQVAMQPGKPQGFGLLGDVPIFTLPGNPVSAYVSFQVFVAPALRAMAGIEPVEAPLVPAEVTESVTSPAGKTRFLRARVRPGEHGLRVTPVGGHGSHLMGSLARSNALIVVPPERDDLVAGEQVSVLMLDQES